MKVTIKNILFALLLSTTLGTGIAQEDTVLRKKRVVYTGFVNVVSDDVSFPLIGFINLVIGNYSGLEIGLVNIDLGQKSGFQIGMMNYAKGQLSGSQIGFINLSDSISSGISVGFLSIIKKRGYRVIEISANEFYPFCIAFKTGTTQFYSSLQIASRFRENDPLGFGISFGRLFPLKDELSLNSEIGSYSSFSSAYNLAIHFSTNLRYSVFPKMQIFTGVALSWINGEQGQNFYLLQPSIPVRFEIDNQNKIQVGLRFGLSYELNWTN